MSIHGTVHSGGGGASKAMSGERLREREGVAGVRLVPGTLNVHVSDVDRVVEALGEPGAHSGQENPRLGLLRWWPVSVSDGKRDADAWVVRHERTHTRYLEIVSATDFRAEGVRDGDVLTLEPR